MAILTVLIVSEIHGRSGGIDLHKDQADIGGHDRICRKSFANCRAQSSLRIVDHADEIVGLFAHLATKFM